MNLAKFPRHKLTFGPTPIEKLERLSKHLGGKVEIFAKRDDCNSGLAFGGNKVRKMEYLVPGRAGAGLRHARHHRRHPVEPYAAGGGGRREARA